MKALILTINNNVLNGLEDNACSKFLSANLFAKGVDLIGCNTISNSEQSINNAFKNLSD